MEPKSKFTRIFGGNSSPNPEPVSKFGAPVTPPSYEPEVAPVTPVSGYAPAPTPSVASYGAPSSSAPAMGSKNVLNSDVEVVGSLKFTDNLLVDGYVDGNITSQGILTIGQNATVKAEINTSSVIIYGKLHGNINVTNSVEIKGTAEVVGDIKAASIAIEPGAIFIGRSDVGAPTPINWERAKKPTIASPSAPAKSSSSDVVAEVAAESDLVLDN